MAREESKKPTGDYTAWCDCGDTLEREGGVYPKDAIYYCLGCDESSKLVLVKEASE